MNWKNDKAAWYNPFLYIAGGKALLVGLLIILLTSVAGSFSGVWFPGVIDIKIGFQGPVTVHLAASVVAWLAITLVLYVIALLLSPSRVRLLDIAGTQALARVPLLLASLTGFSGIIQKATHYWLYLAAASLQGIIPAVEAPARLMPWEWTLAISLMLLQLALLVWMIALMYNGYRVSANLRGMRAGLSFALGLFAAQIITNVITFFFFSSFTAVNSFFQP